MNNKKPFQLPQICRYFAASGNCYYGDNCQFSHGGSVHGSLSGFSVNSAAPTQSSNRDMNFGNMLNQDPLFRVFCSPSSQAPSSITDALPAESKLKIYMTSSCIGGKVSPSGYSAESPDVSGFAVGHSRITTGGTGLSESSPNPLVPSFSQMSINPTSSQSDMFGKLSHSVSSPSFPVINDNLHGHFRHVQDADGFETPRETPTPPTLSAAGGRRKISKSPTTAIMTPDSATGAATSQGIFQDTVGGTTYFYNADEPVHRRPNVIPSMFTAYTGPPSNVAHMKPKGAGVATFFVSNELKMELMQRHSLLMATADPCQFPDLPQEVDAYHNLLPLEAISKNPLSERGGLFGYVTTAYKATSTKDGLVYCLRRVHGFRLVSTKCLGIVEMWKKQQHSNIVQLREVFTSKAFGDHSLVFAYDYHPTAETIKSRHFSGMMRMNGLNNSSFDDDPGRFRTGFKVKPHMSLLPESLIWCYVVQLSSALRAIHAAGLAARTIDPSKILILGKSRLLINCVGVFDVLTFDQTQSNPVGMLQHFQQEDLVNLGRLVLALACNSLLAVQREQFHASVETVARHYSQDLKNLIVYLLTPQSRIRSVNEIMPMIGARFYSQLDAAQMRIDLLENELAKEIENGRLFRLLCKLGVVNERPEYNLDPSWSETGDRYLLKLFRDYLFHQVSEDGRPWLDMAHMVQCLNKMDAGSPEKVTLMSRDEQNVLVVSFADIKRCLESSFNEVLLNSADALPNMSGL